MDSCTDNYTYPVIPFLRHKKRGDTERETGKREGGRRGVANNLFQLSIEIEMRLKMLFQRSQLPWSLTVHSHTIS